MSETFKAGDKVWHPKTKLFGIVVATEGMTRTVEIDSGWTTWPVDVPMRNIAVAVEDLLAVGNGARIYETYVWSIDSVELLDEEEFKFTSELVKWKKRKTELNKQIKEAGSEYAAAETNMIEYLLRVAAQGTRYYANIGQVTIDGKNIHASITEENKELAFKEIEAMGRGEIIKRTVHPSTLEAFVSELQDTGVPVPKHISVYETPKLSFAKKK